MRPDDRVRLAHMLDAARAAGTFVEGRGPADLEADRMLLFAVVRALEIVGEAGARVSPELQQQLRTIPWAAVVGMRNRLVHGYFDVDPRIVWQTLVEDLPGVVAVLETALAGPSCEQ